MNKQLYEQLYNQTQEYYYKNNILNYIDALKDSQNINTQIVKKCFLQSNFWTINPMKYNIYAITGQIKEICISNLEVNQRSMKLLKCFLQAFPQIQGIFLWNNKLDIKSFEEILKKLQILECIALSENNIGKNMGEYLKVLNLNNIKSLRIISEPIGNKSIKTMMKMEWPSLDHLYWENTDLTTDFIKILTKLPHCLSNIEFLGHNRVITTILVRNIVKITRKYDCSIIRVTPFFDPNDSYFVGDLLKSSSTRTAINFAVHRQIYIRYPMNINFQCPDKVKKVTDPFISVGWQQQRN